MSILREPEVPVIIGLLALIIALMAWGFHVEHKVAIYLDRHNCARTMETKTTYINVNKVLVPLTENRWVCPNGEIVWH
jgi:hypothetical protein